MTNEVPAGLSPDAELRYRMVAHVLNTRLVSPDAAAFAAEELVRYVKDGPQQRAIVAAGVGARPVSMPSYTVADALRRAQAAPVVGVGTGTWSSGETHQIRQEDQLRPQEPSRD